MPRVLYSSVPQWTVEEWKEEGAIKQFLNQPNAFEVWRYDRDSPRWILGLHHPDCDQIVFIWQLCADGTCRGDFFWSMGASSHIDSDPGEAEPTRNPPKPRNPAPTGPWVRGKRKRHILVEEEAEEPKPKKRAKATPRAPIAPNPERRVTRSRAARNAGLSRPAAATREEPALAPPPPAPAVEEPRPAQEQPAPVQGEPRPVQEEPAAVQEAVVPEEPTTMPQEAAAAATATAGTTATAATGRPKRATRKPKRYED